MWQMNRNACVSTSLACTACHKQPRAVQTRLCQNDPAPHSPQVAILLVICFKVDVLESHETSDAFTTQHLQSRRNRSPRLESMPQNLGVESWCGQWQFKHFRKKTVLGRKRWEEIKRDRNRYIEKECKKATWLRVQHSKHFVPRSFSFVHWLLTSLHFVSKYLFQEPVLTSRCVPWSARIKTFGGPEDLT